MESIQLSSDPNIDREILSHLDDDNLLTACRTNKYTYELCDENFWKQQSNKTFGPYMDKKPDHISYKEWYRFLSENRRGTNKRGEITGPLIKAAISRDDPEFIKSIYPDFASRLPDQQREVSQRILAHQVSNHETPLPKLVNWIIHSPEFEGQITFVLDKLIDIGNLDLDTLLHPPFDVQSDSVERTRRRHIFPFLEQAVIDADNDTINYIMEEANMIGGGKLFSGSDVTDLLIKHNNFESARMYIENGHPPTNRIECILNEALNLDGLKFLLSIGIELTYDGLSCSLGEAVDDLSSEQLQEITQKQLDILDFYRDQNVDIGVDVDELIHIGNGELLNWFTENGYIDLEDVTIEHIIDYGTQSMLNKLFEMGVVEDYIRSGRFSGDIDSLTLDKFMLLLRFGAKFTLNQIFRWGNDQINEFVMSRFYQDIENNPI